MAIKDAAYYLQLMQDTIRGRLPNVVFRAWDPLSTWLDAISKRLAEGYATLLQVENDFYIDSAAGERLDRRLMNEFVDRLEPLPADDGQVTVSRQTPPLASFTFPAGSIEASPPPDPSNPTATRPVFVNKDPLTIAPPDTSWTADFVCTTGGTAGNLPAGTQLQLITNTNLLDAAVVATSFTTGTDAEADADYRLRGKLEVRSRGLGTRDALLAATLRAGAAFAAIAEDFTPGNPPVTLYAANSTGGLPAQLVTDIMQQVNGDPQADPPIRMSRVAGIPVQVLPMTTVTISYTIGLVVTANVVGPLLTALQADIAEALEGYVGSMNSLTNPDRVHRVNQAKDIIMAFKGRGVLDIDDGTFAPAANHVFSEVEWAAFGGVTWL